ncbi:MAG: glycosyl hydrolase, partial [Chitinophagaceae bacterium]|nr:glycosyl hydrolase [Chitinophagaceae bacterium]
MKKALLLLGLGITNFLFAQLTIYSEPGQAGTSATCANSTIYKGVDIPGGLNKQISSIHLLKDHIATLAENEDGSGEAYTFVAAVSDVKVDLSRFLNDKVSFIRVLPFRQTKKKGVGNVNNAFIEPIDVDWFYDWGALDVTLPTREYAMQAWGRQAASNPANIANYIAKPDVTHLLSFNEPDNSTQANIPVADAIPLHKLLSATGLRLGSPAPTESEAFVWLRDFMAGTRAQNIKVDHIVIHWYDWGNWNSTGNTAPTPQSVFNRFTAYVNRVYSIYGKPIWIKEFNANRNTTSATHEGFIALALPWLEQQPFIERYAYFFPPAHPPVDGNGVITPIGQAYKNFSGSTPAITKNIDNTELFADDVDKRFEAELYSTRFGSNTVNCATASGGQMVQGVTGGSNRVAFHNIVIPESGSYNMDVSYFSTTARNLTLRINHAPAQVISIPASGPWCFEGGSPATATIPINLLSGTNTIEFTDAPIIDFIEVKKNGTLPVSWLGFNGIV